MITKRLLTIILTSILCIHAYDPNDLDSFLLIVFDSILIITMIWHREFWATYILSTGFISYLAKDFKQAHRQGAVIELLGWILLTISLITSFLVE